MRKWCLGGFVVFMIAPKVPIFSAGVAEIRLEDLVAAIVVVPVLARGRLLRTPLIGGVNRYAAHLLVLAAAAVVNFPSVGPLGALHVGRLLQYLAWYFVGTLASDGRSPEEDTERIVAPILLVAFLWAVFESLEFIPKLGKFEGSNGRVSLFTTGPYEAAAIASIGVFLSRRSSRRFAGLGVVVLTAARVSLATVALGSLGRVLRSKRLTVVGALLIVLAAIVPTARSAFQLTRIADTPSLQSSVSIVSEAWQRAPSVTSPADYTAESELEGNVWSYVPGIGDPSTELRAVRWSILIKSTTSDLQHVVLGRGPGFWGLAVDGNYFRIFGESGILGLATFAWFIAWLLGRRQTEPLVFRAVMVLGITALFIDIFSSSKAMAMLWMVLGIHATRVQSLESKPVPLNEAGLRRSLVAA